MWILILALACGRGDAPQEPAPVPVPEAPSLSPQTTPVQSLSMEEQIQAGNIAANQLLGMLMGDEGVSSCLGELQGSSETARMGFHMAPGGELVLVFESGRDDVDACVHAAHARVDYSEVTVPVPFEVETQVPL